MPKYVFVINVTISLATEVEAQSLAEAVAEAKSRSPMSIPAACAGDQDAEWATDEIDCDPSVGVLVDFFGPDTFEDAEEAWGGGEEEA